MSKNGNLDDATLQALASAVVKLDPQPRPRRWVSLSLCIADAVWSIGAHYDNPDLGHLRGVRKPESL